MSTRIEPTTPAPSPVPGQGRAPGLSGIAGVLAVVAGAALILLLQFIPPTDAISPLRRTISEYGLSTHKWIFDTAVVLVAGGSAVLFAAHVLRRALPPLPAVAGALWTVSLLVIVAFPKTNWAVGPSVGGVVHRIASVVGFVCLPIGILLASRRIFSHSSIWRRMAQGLAVASLLWFGLVLGAIVVFAAGGGLPWWQAIPLGLVERGMALTEILTIITLAVPLLRRE